MAVPISKTIGELFEVSGGKSCKSTLDSLDVFLPGWTEDSVVDVLTYLEALRVRGEARNLNAGILNFLTVPQQKAFITWALDSLIQHTPAGYSRKAAMINLYGLLTDYINAPTAPKKANLLTIAKGIRPVTSSEAELHVANAFKGATYNVANNTVTGESLNDLARSLYRAGSSLAGVPVLTGAGVVLTQLEKIIGVID
jgi:hypothetical protein